MGTINEKGYGKENCVWANATVQNNNSRRNLNYRERYFSEVSS